ncbi:hypothetical protein FRC14_000993 [Serendipita sp. 396]|nr:hypothetical protein FRC14_000993 [Serendipita sp. 396]
MASVVDKELANLSGEVTLLGKPPLEGSYSNVYQGNWGGEVVAIKVLKSVGATHTMRRKIRREGMVSGAMCHPNVLPCLGYVEGDEQFGLFGALVSPWCTNGDAAKFLRRHGSSLSLAQRITLWKGVVEGVNYLHHLNPVIVHGDLKPANILLDENWIPRICDFGLARIVLEKDSSGMTTTTVHTGSVRYLAYELVVSEDIVMPTPASDVHALGCVGLDFIFLHYPYSNRQHNARGHIFHDIRQGLPPAPCPADLCGVEESCWNIISSCWDKNPVARPDTRTLLSALHTVISLPTENLVSGGYMDGDDGVLDGDHLRQGTSVISGSILTLQVDEPSSLHGEADHLSVGHIPHGLDIRTSLQLVNISIQSTTTVDEETLKRRPTRRNADLLLPALRGEGDWDDAAQHLGKPRGKRSHGTSKSSPARAPSRLPTKDWHPTTETLPTGDDRRKFDIGLQELDQEHQSIVINYGGNTFWMQRLVLQMILAYHNKTGNWPMRVSMAGTSHENEEALYAECMICGHGRGTQKFKVQQIARHLTSEEWKLKPWRCMFCPTAFSHNDGSLQTHLKQVHNKEESTSSPTGIFTIAQPVTPTYAILGDNVTSKIQDANLLPRQPPLMVDLSRVGDMPRPKKSPLMNLARKFQRNAGSVSHISTSSLPHQIGIRQALVLSTAVATSPTGSSASFVTSNKS